MLFERTYSGSQKSEVCPMPYALCPMPVGYLIFLRKAIISSVIRHVLMTQHKNRYLRTTGVAISPKFSTLVRGPRFISGVNLKSFDARAGAEI